ncbi:4-hydroxy-tetrahydrodipicolinate reductase [Blochmannia endosymbiont of Camponotus sp. C-046]|uniref:4-hydroxy-tetrahydrodipicolinate reductase n=1 Tax=Blochmannia endosymbiont of Camponotus sp. C-046 TaxID=2945589 RepID=UPI002024DCE2|nr:4-hydroxy-tetrahydrodipicolinate reductase [Blochmannia endosymbiont of Camponotus sp. C-046]URJ28587.1 4-hydroxy-tetrahydrodipicolinate reductase [Blochmannia endosymbiont of Camponotus sp. C-046]
MSGTFLRIAVTGVTGRMGKEIVKCIVKGEKQFSQEIVLGAAIARLNTNICGMDVGTLINADTLGVTITDNLESIKDNFDVLIDFTAPDVSVEYLKFCVNNNKNIVIGTTGFNKIHKNLILNASHKIGIVFSSNFSIGVALIFKLLHRITQIIGSTSDINIIETHHNKKRDIPSGTALTMQNIIVNTLRSVRSNKIMDSNLDSTTYAPTSSCDNILIHSIRAGNVVGEHTVLFAGLGERLEITHKASDRLIFAHGALRAAL